MLDYIDDGDDVIFEQKPLKSLAKEEEIFAYKHDGFWKPMDTLRDKKELVNLWISEKAPWKLW